MSPFRLFLGRAERIYVDLDLAQKIELSAFLIENAASSTVSFPNTDPLELFTDEAI